MPHAAFPAWLHGLAIASLALAVVCALVIVADETRRVQHMAVMYLVWPLTALFGSVLLLAFYWRFGRGMSREEHQKMMHDHGGGDGGMKMASDTPMPIAVAKGALHCGAGCALGDLIGESLAFAVPGVAVLFGWRSLFGERMFAVWGLDFVVAFLLGIAFQYFTIKPMRKLSTGEGLVQALKADAASITAWQVGMYACMALAQFAWLRPAYGAVAQPDAPEFWLVMQAAMLCGFVTSYPVNWLLVRAGVKEKM